MENIAGAYHLLRQTLSSTKELTDVVRQVAVYSTVPPIADSPELKKCISRGISAIHRVRFTSEEEPNETFKHPGIIVVNRESRAQIAPLIAQANLDRDHLIQTISSLKEDQDKTPERNIIRAIIEHHRANNYPDDIPLIGSPDRIKLRQLTRSIRFFSDVQRARFTLEEKLNIRSISLEKYIEQAQDRGLDLLAQKISSYKPGELKKVSRPTRRWRVALMTDQVPEIKIATSIPVIVTPSSSIEKVSIKGITDYGVEPKERDRKKRTDKKTLKLAIPECELYVYE